MKISLTRILELAARATPGPWKVLYKSGAYGYVGNWDIDQKKIFIEDAPGAKISWEHDAAFIAALDPGTVQALIEDNRRLVRALEFYGNMEHAQFPEGEPKNTIRRALRDSLVETGWRAREALQAHKEKFDV